MELTLPYFDMRDDRRRLGTLVLFQFSKP